MTVTPPIALTIAGSDSGAGAGIQADLKTFSAFGVYGTTVITTVTAQHTGGVISAHPMPFTLVAAQLQAVLTDLPPVAVKVGALATQEIVDLVAARAADGLLPNLVLDPVMIATSGDSLGGVDLTPLLPYATVTTPNASEARLVADAPRLVITGGDTGRDEVRGIPGLTELSAEPVDTRNTHGTGCTFSAAIAARLAHGDDLAAALIVAKEFVTQALAGAAGWSIGAGPGPLNHWAGSRPGNHLEARA